VGGGRWDTEVYTASTTTRRARGVTDDFEYHTAVKTGKASGIHVDLDPAKVAGPTSPVAGMPIRESRDGPDHPESKPVMAIFDVTGSNIAAARKMQEKLPRLMDIILEKVGMKDPQVLVGAVGDSTPSSFRGMGDKYPFQVGQFESDNRFDEQLRNLILEGGGGGQHRESYGLAYRFAAHHTVHDAWEKRGQKGYMFTMGDEAPWPTVTVADIQNIFGVTAEKDETVQDLIALASEKWEIYHIFCEDGSYKADGPEHIGDDWRKLLGERFVSIADSSLICEFIAGIISMLETSRSVDTVVTHDLGLSGRAAEVVKNALVPIAGRLPAHIATGAVPTGHGTETSGVIRI
jgi:hypothetical protein